MSREEVSPVDPHETLYLPMRRRFVSEYVSNPEGVRELRIYYGLKEITIEEPELQPFGENLLKQDEFMAGSATTWTNGEPLPWQRVQELLTALVKENILSREAPKAATETAYHKRLLQMEAERVAPTEPLWWNPDTAHVTRTLTGRPLELGYVEAMLPVHRLAHPAIDAENRHVGESNVFPDTMRMKKETEFKACPYPGSRYRDDALMNVTALRSMTRHWKPTLQGVLKMREEFLRRYPLLPDGRWRLGDLHAFSCAVLALPTLMLMRQHDPIPNGTMDPVLSSIFRVTDGVRMVAIYLMHLPEQPMPYDHPISAAELLHLTERDNHFLSTRGVCAGPPHMVDEFFATMLDGKPLADGSTPTTGHDAEIPKAIDYGLRGIQHYSLQFNLWSHMGLAYERIREQVLKVEDPSEGPWGKLRKRVELDWKIIIPTRQHTSVQREWAGDRYVEMFENAQRGLPGFREDTLVRFKPVYTPERTAQDARVAQQLREVLHARAGTPPGGDESIIGAIADALTDFLAKERSVVGALEDIQRHVNVLAGREHPTRRFTNLDLAIHLNLRKNTIGVMPYLLEVFKEQLGIIIESSADTTRIETAAVASAA
ncbi:hypothetical protein [Pyxidicoccus xibeiensis]|uniref:hypothetical protein n=1 Tax=Pyxidicoccus xibeiensis TaxID=2906759 RepID=UPI0020A80C5A|nr:hypothetical protein [Pyxidicoccus xibeiensis]MCP3141528.1 hypothetical protein [Pyxidicoccus xibeiensis]